MPHAASRYARLKSRGPARACDGGGARSSVVGHEAAMREGGNNRGGEGGVEPLVVRCEPYGQLYATKLAAIDLPQRGCDAPRGSGE